jgi:hypothetical protein
VLLLDAPLAGLLLALASELGRILSVGDAFVERSPT